MHHELDEARHDDAGPPNASGPNHQPAGPRVIIEATVLDAQSGRLLVDQINSREELRACGRWMLDFQLVRFVDSAGASALADLIRETGGRDRIHFIGLGPRIRNRWPNLFNAASAAAQN